MFSRNVWVSTRFHLSTHPLDLGGGTLALEGSHCRTLGGELLVGVCCPFGLPRNRWG